MKYALRIIVAALVIRLIIFPKEKSSSLKTLSSQAPKPEATCPPEPERPTEAQVDGSFLGIPSEYSFLMTLVLVVCSLAIGGMIGFKKTHLLMLTYFSYWLPCAAALVFGMGAAYRPTLGKKGGRPCRAIFEFTDKELFEWSALLFYFGILINIYISDCSWPSSELFINTTVAVYSLMYVHWSSRRPQQSIGDEFRLLGMVVIVALTCFVLFHTWLEIKMVGFKCYDYKWRYR